MTQMKCLKLVNSKDRYTQIYGGLWWTDDCSSPAAGKKHSYVVPFIPRYMGTAVSTNIGCIECYTMDTDESNAMKSRLWFRNNGGAFETQAAIYVTGASTPWETSAYYELVIDDLYFVVFDHAQESSGTWYAEVRVYNRQWNQIFSENNSNSSWTWTLDRMELGGYGYSTSRGNDMRVDVLEPNYQHSLDYLDYLVGHTHFEPTAGWALAGVSSACGTLKVLECLDEAIIDNEEILGDTSDILIDTTDVLSDTTDILSDVSDVQTDVTTIDGNTDYTATTVEDIFDPATGDPDYDMYDVLREGIGVMPDPLGDPVSPQYEDSVLEAQNDNVTKVGYTGGVPSTEEVT